MAIRYTYEVDGQLAATWFKVDLPSFVKDAGVLQVDQLRDLFQSNGVYTDELRLISYYDPSTSLYVPFTTPLPIPPDPSFFLQLVLRKERNAEIKELMEEVAALAKKVEALENPQQLLLESQQSLIQSHSVYPRSSIDVAVLLAAPLVRVSGRTRNGLYNSNLDFESDKRALLKYLRANSIKIAVRFEAATLQNLAQMLQSQPSILQIECHGCFKNDIGSFYLAFEDTRNMGELKEVNKDMLTETLQEAMKGNVRNLIVLVNACYSQTVASVFLKAGVRCVIAVHQQTRVLDTAVKMFTQEFYRQLFFCHQSIREAYNLAVQSVRREQSSLLTCCCAHEHTPTCKWARRATHDREAVDVCKEHIATCSCPNARVSNFHKPQCDWARDFLDDFMPDRELSDKELKEGYIVCCCKPDVPHGEGMKFILFADSEFETSFIDSRECEEIKLHPSDKPTPPLITTRIIGQHDKIQEIVAALGKHTDSRCINVIGDPKVGKTVLVKRAAYYAFERQAFTDGVIYIDMTGRSSFSYIYRQIENAMKTSGIKTKRDLCNFISGLALLIIIDGTEDILRHEHSDFVQKLLYIAENTILSKIMIVSQEKINIEGTIVIRVNPLSPHRSAELLVLLTGEILPSRMRKNLTELGKHRLFSLIGTSPHAIKLLANNIKTADDLDLIVRTHEQGLRAQTQETIAYQMASDFLAANPHREKLFRLLSFFPSGLHKSDIVILCDRLGIDHQDNLPGFGRQNSDEEGKTNWFVEEHNDWFTAHTGFSQYISKTESFQARNEFVSEVVRYLAELSRSLMRIMASTSPYIDLTNLKMFNAVVDHGLWGSPTEVEINLVIPDSFIPKKYYERHERNFLHFLNPDRLMEIVGEAPSSGLMTIIGELALCTATCCLLIWSKDQALETLHLGLRVCERFHIQKAFCSLLLMEAGLIDSKEQSESLRLTAFQGFSDLDCADGLVETYLFQLLYKDRLGSKELRDMTELLKNQFARTHNCSLARARMDLAIAEHRIQTETARQQILNQISSAFDVFVQLKKEHWAVRCLIAKIDYYLYEDTTKDVLRIYSDAVLKSQPLKNQILGKLLSEKQVLINRKLPKRSENVISFLKSYPLVKGFERAGSVARVFNTFRMKIVEMFKSVKKQVYVRFDSASFDNLLEALQGGCCALHLSSTEYADNGFIFENPDGSAHFVPIPELITRLKKISSPAFKLVVIEAPFAETIAERLHADLGLPHVIGFHMKNFTNAAEYFPVQAVVDEAVCCFSVALYDNLLRGLTVKEAFLAASTANDAFLTANQSKVTKAFADTRAKSEWEKVAKGAFLVDPENEIHNRRLFEVSQKQGDMQDLSRPRAPSNLQKEIGAHIGRHIELYKAIKTLEEGKCAHITGSPGTGKTMFLKDLGYQFLLRGRYLDGIYYLSLKGKASVDEALRSLDLIQSADQLNSLQGKKMLLLMDDCDTLTRRQNEQQFRFLLHFLAKKCMVGIAFTSSFSFLSPESRDYINQTSLSPFSPEESAVLCYTINPELSHLDVDPFCEKESLVESLAVTTALAQACLSLKKVVSLADSSRADSEVFKVFTDQPHDGNVPLQFSSHMSEFVDSSERRPNSITHDLSASYRPAPSFLQRQFSIDPVSPPMQFSRPVSGRHQTGVMMPLHERQDSEDQSS